jgi:hypothetical protein
VRRKVADLVAFYDEVQKVCEVDATRCMGEHEMRLCNNIVFPLAAAGMTEARVITQAVKTYWERDPARPYVKDVWVLLNYAHGRLLYSQYDADSGFNSNVHAYWYEELTQAQRDAFRQALAPFYDISDDEALLPDITGYVLAYKSAAWYSLREVEYLPLVQQILVHQGPMLNCLIANGTPPVAIQQDPNAPPDPVLNQPPEGADASR